MNFDVMLFKQPENGYVARPIFWPDVAAHGETEQEAIDRVRELLRDLLNQVQVVKVEIDLPANQTNNPWLTKAGMFANDPTWDDFLKVMHDYRQQLGNEKQLTSE